MREGLVWWCKIQLTIKGERAFDALNCILCFCKVITNKRYCEKKAHILYCSLSPNHTSIVLKVIVYCILVSDPSDSAAKLL